MVWQGKRSSKASNIYFARVSKSGEILEQKPIQLSPSLKDQVSASVAFDGTNYFVVWQDFINGQYWNIYGARVTSEGGILDQGGFLITNTDPSGTDRWRPVLSWNGDYYFVAWMASSESGEWYLYGKRVASGGQLMDVADRLIQRDTANKTFPAILWDGTEHLLVWEEDPEGDSRIFGMSILAEGYAMSESRQISDLSGMTASLPAVSSTER